MLKLSLKLGEQLNIGDDIRIIYRSAGTSGIKIVLDVPKEMPIARAGTRPDKADTRYRQDSWNGIEAEKEKG